MKKICIVHYNTPKLTECLVRSINKCMTDTLIYIFDNSDKKPYTYITDNVKVIDNTKGQIINFDEWLKKYPDRTKSNGRANNYGSPKHSYSVQKAIEIIKDNFVLLDSDVLIKKDFSDIFDNRYAYVGESVLQPLSTIHRVLPFLCYLNVNMLNKNNVPYFDDNFMHGLRKTANSDRYDTGASLYVNASKLQHKDIKLEEYITHYKGGSWETTHNKTYNKNLSSEEWLMSNKRYWSAEKAHKVIYTCITGGYDTLLTPKVFDNDYDYICFTDNMSLPSNGWTLKKIPEELNGLSNVKKQRIIKICPHKYLKEYDMSVWVDASVKLTSSVSSYVNDKCKKENGHIFIPQHPNRSCIYDEASVCIKCKKDTSDNINPQIERYRKEGFPKKYGLVQSNIAIRYHNEADCVKLMDMWAEELKKGSHRDQLSFDYARWKNQDAKFMFLDKTTCKRTPFMWGSHKPQKLTNAKASVHIPSEVVRVKTSANQNALNSESPKNTAMANYVRKQRAAIRNIRTFTSEY